MTRLWSYRTRFNRIALVLVELHSGLKKVIVELHLAQKKIFQQKYNAFEGFLRELDVRFVIFLSFLKAGFH